MRLDRYADLTGLRPGGDRHTFCLSTQVGCPLACSFCATGAMGFSRNLRVSEIVDQLLWMRSGLPEGETLTNVVFMGMGEPLANYDATMDALRRIHDDIGIGARRLTVSTVGLVPGIRRLAEEELPVNLAVSLHAADDRLREVGDGDPEVAAQQVLQIGEVLDVMQQLVDDGMTMLTVTHEMGFAREVADTMVFMDQGQIVEYAPAKEFFSNPREERCKAFLEQILNH